MVSQEGAGNNVKAEDVECIVDKAESAMVATPQFRIERRSRNQRNMFFLKHISQSSECYVSYSCSYDDLLDHGVTKDHNHLMQSFCLLLKYLQTRSLVLVQELQRNYCKRDVD